MNLTWNKNISQFCTRFPELAKKLFVTPSSPEPETIPWTRTIAKNGEITASENNVQIHSKYNPTHEAEEVVKNSHSLYTESGIFLGCGLGYGPIAYARLFSEDTVIIIEPDPYYFFAALASIDWTDFFTHKKCILFIAAETDDVYSFILQSCKKNTYALFSIQSFINHATDYFKEIKACISHNTAKENINSATLERFSTLWLSNSCRNLTSSANLDGINKFFQVCPKNLPIVILGAGPSLAEILPSLAVMKKRAIIICVDTALRACLQYGIEPDFIILVDPQYYASRHIQGLKALSSTLITESAVYPPVFRFPCKEIVLCSSLFPLGKYFEKRTFLRGSLAAGGSVATSAWDFARFAGAQQIYFAGLDLGYPDGQTHIRGSTAEETIHATSTRIKTAESGFSSMLYSAPVSIGSNYEGKPIKTDDRMKLFAWWFETHVAQNPAIQTWSLSSQSLAIPGIKSISPAVILNTPERDFERKIFFEAASQFHTFQDPNLFEQACRDLADGFRALQTITRCGIEIAEKALEGTTEDIYEGIHHLEKIDARIAASEVKMVAELVFPTDTTLTRIFEERRLPENKAAALISKSLIIYQELEHAVERYQDLLKKCGIF